MHVYYCVAEWVTFPRINNTLDKLCTRGLTEDPLGQTRHILYEHILKDSYLVITAKANNI